jgi:hypothetical protein
MSFKKPQPKRYWFKLPVPNKCDKCNGLLSVHFQFIFFHVISNFLRGLISMSGSYDLSPAGIIFVRRCIETGRSGDRRSRKSSLKRCIFRNGIIVAVKDIL